MSSSVIEKPTLNHWPEYKQRWEFSGSAEEAVQFVGGIGGYEATMQKQFMLDRGLKPEHKFLDFPCGCLRGTIRLVDYMEDGNFFGGDISIGLLKEGLIECQRQGFKKTPFLQYVDAFDLSRVFDTRFDFILSVSLLTHIYPEDVPAYFKGLASVLKPGGKAFITLYPLDEGHEHFFKGDIHLCWYKRSWLMGQAEAQGLRLSEPAERIPCRLPRGAKPILTTVNSNLAQWVLEASLA